MPYIKQNRRDEIEVPTEKFTAGELNYFITRLLLNQNPKNYKDYNGLIGVLESCKLEFFRRHMAEYEKSVIKRNGDL